MSDKVGTRNPQRAHKLRPDNFTPPARTPWGGRGILDLKAELDLESAKRRYSVVGESWELSVEPDFPSTLVDGTPLAVAIAQDPAGWLGRHAGLGSTPLLVKLLDAAAALSVQIHPSDDDIALKEDESGKPECWVVVDATADAGVYLGLRDGVTRSHMAAAIADGDDVSDLLQFVNTEPGDVFVIEAGTPHAIGAGVMLVEPQAVTPGKRGVTYRYWDWNRRYDKAGKEDPAGSPRTLHVERALDVTDWRDACGNAPLSAAHARTAAPDMAGTARRESLIGTDGALRSSRFAVSRLHGSGPLELAAADYLRCMTVLEGTVVLADGTRFDKGESACLPAAMPAASAMLECAHAIVSAVT